MNPPPSTKRMMKDLANHKRIKLLKWKLVISFIRILIYFTLNHPLALNTSYVYESQLSDSFFLLPSRFYSLQYEKSHAENAKEKLSYSDCSKKEPSSNNKTLLMFVVLCNIKYEWDWYSHAIKWHEFSMIA